MRTLRPTLPLALLLSLVSAPLAGADVINLLDGSTIDDVRIESEGLLEITYKGKKSGSVDTDSVLSIEYSKKPVLVDQADAAVADDAIFNAIDDLEEYIEGVIGKEQKREPWAPAYAMYRVIELQELVGDAGAVVSGADRLIQNAGESRYAPMALLKKAQAQFDGDKAAEALSTIDALGQMVTSKGLSKRWQLEEELQRILFNTELKGSQRRERLEGIVAGSDEFPLVRNRAYVAVGESYFEGKKYDDAEAVFRDVVGDPKADPRTLAAAYTGLGDCMFQRGANSKDAAVLKDAVLSYMRVVVSYPEEVRYVPKAMFYAGRSFQLMDGDENAGRASKLYLGIMRDYGGTKWAQEARNFR